MGLDLEKGLTTILNTPRIGPRSMDELGGLVTRWIVVSTWNSAALRGHGESMHEPKSLEAVDLAALSRVE